MAVRDQVTLFNGYQGNYDTITTNTTTVGAIFDTSAHELGFSVLLSAPAWTDGTYTLKLEEGEESDMSDGVDIPAAKLIGALPAVSAATVDGAELGKIGVFSNLRYIRVSIVSTGVTDGATIRTTVIKHAENCPA